MTAPLLSVITIVKNDAAGLSTTTASVRSQTCQAFEWIVIDGGSTDDTLTGLAGMQAPTVLLTGNDQGPYDGMNKGLNSATGAYVLFLNAGDTLAGPATLASLSELLQASQPDFTYGDCLEHLAQNRIAYKRARSYRYGWWGMFTHHQAMIYRRSAIGRRRFDLRWTIAADYDFTMQHLARSSVILRINHPLIVFRDGGLARRSAARGRLEQRLVRTHVLGYPTWMSWAIWFAQGVSGALRRRIPGLFEALRFRESSISTACPPDQEGTVITAKRH